MPERVLIAKPGLDGHDRGAKVIAYALREAGFEIIYTGIRQRPRDIVTIAIQEDVDVVGLSILSGSHIALTKKVVEGLRSRGAADISVVVGGTIPDRDRNALVEAGAAAVFPTGTSLQQVVNGVRAVCQSGIKGS